MAWRRMGAAVLLMLSAFVAAGVMGAPPASAHPLGNFTVNRYSELVVSPGRLSVTYVLDMAEIPTFQEMERIDANGDGRADRAELETWADRAAREIGGDLHVSLDGRTLPLRLESRSVRIRSGQAGLSVLYLTVSFGASLPDVGALTYRDGNQPDRQGWSEVVVRAGSGVVLRRSTAPVTSVSDRLLRYPKDLLSSPLAVRSASLSFEPGASAAGISSESAPVQEVEGPRGGGGVFVGLVGRTLTPWVLLASLLLAFGFGAVHALMPGHGKTIMAAYLLGSGAKVRQAMSVGVAVSLMHTGSVLALGLVTLYVFRLFDPEDAYPWLGMLSGLVALGLGGALLMSRTRARKSHGDADHAHPHHHDGEHHEHTDRPRSLSRKGMAALALSGGMLPSPTALVVLTGAIAAHRVGYGLALLVCFSLGLATALTAIGLVTLRARDFVSVHTAGRGMRRVAGWLPIASAGIILVFGVAFTARSVLQLV